MVKLQQFLIMKFDSERLKSCNYKIEIDLDSARKNNEVVSVAFNQVIKTIFRLKQKNYDPNIINDLVKEKKKLSRLLNTQENQAKYNQVIKQIDEILFVPELISIQFSNKTHYQKMLKNGLFINGKHYVRLLAGAGNIRKNTVVFCDSEIKNDLVTILDNGRDTSQKLVPAKYNAYFSLLNSSMLEVSFPKFCVVKDCTMNITRPMDNIATDETGRDIVEANKLVEISANSFDGQGLISPRLSEQWAYELELDYLPANFIIRAPFIKGMVVTFDFHAFANDVAKTNEIIDVYGNKINVNEVDLILSESQFKLWQGYGSQKVYEDNCKKNGLGFGISRVSPKEDKTYARSNYQFLQVLDLDDSEIASLCEPTINHFHNLLGADADAMLLYSLGNMNYSDNWFEHLEPATQAIALNREAANDPYIRNHFSNSLSKKIKESYLGSLYFEGNYSILISDPYAQCEHIFEMPVRGLLEENHHYSSFWNKRNVKEVVACRAPLTFQTEVVRLHLQSEEVQNYWYKYITTGVILPAFGIGIDVVRFADADNDGDLIATYYHPAFLAGVQEGLPITYEKRSANKITIDEEDILSQADINAFGCKVGYITNVSSAMFCLQEKFPVGSPERTEVFNRLKIARKLQGDEIDHGKGIVIKPFPEYWVKWRRITEEMSPEEKAQVEFENSIVVDKRPLFFRFLYPHYNKKYLDELKNYNGVSMANYRIPFIDLMELEERTEDQQKLVDFYYKHSFFLHTNSTMNRISKRLQKSVKEDKPTPNSEFEYSIYQDNVIPFDQTKFNNLNELYQVYKTHKQQKVYEEGEQDRFNEWLIREAGKITNNICELANMAVEICYGNYPKSSKAFCWEIAGEGIVLNMRKKFSHKVCIPVVDADGEIEYLWKKYSLKEISLDENE